jgi:biotin carboxyl carrier protein
MSDALKISGKKVKLPDSVKLEEKLEVRPGGWTLIKAKDGTQRKVIVSQNRNRWSANLTGHLWAGEWVSQDRKVAGHESEGDLVAQFPGKVRKILIEAGSQVAQGDNLVLVEAMKMEFTIRAPFSGKVTRILVQQDQQLSPGDRFLDLEPIQNDI